MELIGFLILLFIILIYLIVISKRFDAADAEVSKPRPIRKVYIDDQQSKQFALEYKQILLRNVEIVSRYELQFVSYPEADIHIFLVPRKEMEKMTTEKVERYVDGTKISFSWTYQYPKPRILIDAENWYYGVKQSGLSVPEYRQYVALHEFMHALGFDHQPCETDVCPVMYQATRGPPPGKKAGHNITSLDWTKKIPGHYFAQ